MSDQLYGFPEGNSQAKLKKVQQRGGKIIIESCLWGLFTRGQH